MNPAWYLQRTFGTYQGIGGALGIVVIWEFKLSFFFILDKKSLSLVVRITVFESSDGTMNNNETISPEDIDTAV